MEQKEYGAGAVKWAFWFLEFKKAALMLADGMSMDDIRKKSAEENIFSASSPERAKTVANTVAARINSLPESFLPMFASSDVSSQKLYCLTACMCHDRLFFEFVYEVIREKMIIGVDCFSDSDLRIFFRQKQAQSGKVARWTDETLKRLGKTYKSMLYESGITDHGRDERKIFRPLLPYEMENWLKENSLTPVWKALKGVV